MAGGTVVQRDVPSIPALALTDYVAKEQFGVRDVTGAPVLTLSMVPSVFVSRAMSALRKAGSMPAAQRLDAIGDAVTIFRDEAIDSIAMAEYRTLTSRVAGLPISNIDYSINSIVAAGQTVKRTVDAAMPGGAVRDWSDPAVAKGSAVWIRKGQTLAIHAAGNSPAIHASWLQALALGFRIAVRPSRRDPLTPYRLISALRQAGFARDEIMMLPTDYGAAEEIQRGADMSVVYGNDEVVRKYAADPRVLVRGPGRSKVLVTADVDWTEHIDAIVQAVAAGGGTSCMSATALFVEGDAGAVAEAVAERLAAVPSLPPQDEDAVLPVVEMNRAKQFDEYFATKSAGARVWLGADGIADRLDDGSAVLRPAVTELGSCSDPRVNVELPWPCVWVAPWSRADGVSAMANSLSVTALTADRGLSSALVAEPSIANLSFGGADADAPHLPHDDYFATFLMKAKTVKRPA